MKIHHPLITACLMASASFAADVKRSDLIGSWQPSFVEGKEKEDPTKHVMHFQADGNVRMAGQTALCSWYYAKTEDGLQLLLVDDGGGDSFMTMVVDIVDGEMTWTPFRRGERTEPLKPGSKVAYRFKKLVK
ncbi:hypothetical protein [Luteolibacter sp. Populi]|uniref:hypothetical protein n=1 Tax=Luteolibacter sp. Populi TaxID=3230487 RepID=UPI0034674D96